MLLGLVGFIGSGKGTAGDFLIEEMDFREDSFAAPLKDACAAIFNWPRELLEGKTPESREWRETSDPWWSEKLGIPDFTPRKAMQMVGTETMRKKFHDHIWVLSLERRLDGDRVVVTDCRFPDEIESLRSMGGCVIRIKRGDDPEWYDEIFQMTQGGISLGSREAYMESHYPDIHSSEWSWIGSNIDYTVENDGSVADLHGAIGAIVKSRV